ncbi:hypothetical protein CBR_g32402 [Chara braunii]|uniref:Uncharacterized protein n=1 Tax=Chara braunii TaxID=69332 RepID=A0A388JYC8_CHABU|nr:hypothetical protein CBR_g32402 [Chara braunii]|eukprot:GBG62819.1 hypothetical protein CBR_g32402 [Chara braunii]
MAGIFQYVERRSKDCKPGVTNSEGCVNFYQAFYFIVTTVLTVQLGDITPHSELGREVVLATIIISLTVIPLQISKISDLAARRVGTRGGTSTTPYSKEEEEKMAAILRERKEKKVAKKKALQEEQAAKLKKIEEEMAREKERLKKEEEQKLKEVEEEEEEDETPLQRKRGQYSGNRDEEMEKRISEWVANLFLGEEEEVAMYIPKDDQEAAMRAWEAEGDVIKWHAMEDEKRMEWKLAVMREKKRRVDATAEAAEELEEVKKIEEQLAAQTKLPNQIRVIARNVARLARIQAEQYDFSRSQHIAVHSIRLGFRDFARELVGVVGAEVGHRLDKTERFCAGAIEGVKAAAPKEEEPRPRREPVKVKFPDSYSGKREENFDNWEANVKTYVHLQQVSLDQHVLIAIHAMRDEAASFARSLVRAANCNDDAVAYSSVTSLAEFMKLLRERFADVARNVKASDKLQTIHARKWKSARALKSTMDKLVVVHDHGVTDTQLVALFYRAMPEAFRGHFFAKSEDPTTTYDSLSREVVAFEARSVSVSTFWHKDLDKAILADNRMMIVEDYVEGVQAYFRLEKDGKVEKVLHSLTLLVEDSLPFDIVLGMDWGETVGATLHLKEHECRLPSPSGEAKTARLFHVSGVENSLAHCCLSAPAFARLVKREKLEEQVFVAYVRPVTEPTEEKPMDPAIAKLLEEFKDLTEPPIGVVPRPIQHRIEIEPGTRTPKGAVYRMSPRELEELRKQLDEFLEKGWIRPNDILVFSKTLQEHQGHLRQVLEKLREANFKINAKKCDWAKTQVLYLGHVLDGDGVKPEDCKIAAIRDWPTPRTLTELRSFLGLANYYRKFVRNFSTIAAPLRRLLRKETIWKWDKDYTSAMKKLKQALIEYPVLKVADPSLPLIVTTDASQYDIGAVLQQDDGNGYRPVEFMSTRMPSEKVAISTYERELYALRQALEHWKHYLLGRHFKVYSDHETLRWLKTQAKMTPKLTRWAAEIDQYDFELKPVKGKYNVVADALSRRADYFGAIVHYLDIGKDLQQKIREAYAQDPVYRDLLKKVKEAPETEPNYRTTEGLLFEKANVFNRLCIPSSEELYSNWGLPDAAPTKVMKMTSTIARPYGGAFSAGKVLGARFVILSGSIRFETVRNYLAELYSPVPKDELAAFPLRVIIMAPFKPSFALKTMLTQYSGLVHFIEGSPLKESDLDRVSAKEATAVYLLANKFSQDYSLEDYGQMARALSVHQYCGPSVRVLVELVNPENRGNPIWDGTGEKNVGARSIETICLQELRFKLLARSCYVKGLSTLLSNLFASAIDFHPPKTGTAEEEYYHGLTQSIYPVLLPAAFVGKPFEKIAELIYTEFSALLVGLDVTASREAPEEGDAEPLRMFPMGELIGANDVGLIIAESLALVKHVSTFGSQTFTDRISSCCIGSVSAEELYVHLCAKMDYEDTWQGGNLSSQGALALGEGSMRGRVFKLDPKKSDPSGWEIKNDMQQMRGSSSNLSVRGYWNEEEPDWYLEIDRKNYSLEEVTEKLLTWPPVLVGGRPSPEVIAGHREIIEEDLTQKTLSLVRLSERHILVCCEGQWPHNLYYFVEHLRLEGFPTPPIVILSPEEPGPEQWGCLGIFEDVYYVKGSGTCELDLMRAGHGECECVVVVAEDIQGTSRPGDDTDQQQASSQLYANDLTNTIIASKAEKGLGGKKGVVVELQYNPTFQYLKPLYQIHPVTVRKMSSRRNRDGLHLFLPSYAMGKGFGANMLDYLLAPSFTNKNTVHIFLAFVHEALSSIERPDEEMGYNQNSDSDKSSDDRRPTTMPAWDLVHRQQQHENEASGSGEDNAVCNEIICVLDIIHVPPGCGGLSYLHLFRHLLHSRGLLSLGLYRAAKDPDGTSTKFGDPSGYVFTNPPHNATVCPLDLVYVFRRRPRNRNTSSST